MSASARGRRSCSCTAPGWTAAAGGHSYAGWKGSLPAEEVQARIEGLRKMLAAQERYELVVIAGAGHVSNLEQPGPFNDALRRFCRDHPPNPGRSINAL